MAFDGSKLVPTSNAGSVPQSWIYSSTDAVTTVRVSGYIPDGYGVKNGDKVEYVKTDASPVTRQQFIANVNPTTKVVDLSDGSAITATNTD